MNFLSQSNFLQALGWAVLNSLWQMALLWVVYQFTTAVFKKISASQKSFLASSLLIAGFAWFIFTFIFFYNKTSADILLSDGFAGISSSSTVNEWLQKSLPVASVAYLILLVLPLLHFYRNYRYVQTIRQYGLSKSDVSWRIFVRNVSSHLGIKKKVEVWISELVNSPVTIGFLKPIILIPVAAVNNLSPQQIEAVLLHELVHIRRFDYLLNLITRFIQVILYYNPFAKAFISIIEREREKSCDEMVMQFQYDPHGYASALLVLEKTNYFPKQLAVAAAGKKNDLLHRIETIMGVNKPQALSFNKLAGLMAGVLCIIAVNALMLMSRSVENKQPISFAKFASPFYFSTAQEDIPDETLKATTKLPENTEASKINLTALTSFKDKKAQIEDAENLPTKVDDAQISYFPTSPYMIPVVHFEKPEIPVLTKKQEADISEAINCSKRVIEEVQWKEVEAKIADVFTQRQKEELKAEYQKEISKLDLKKWEEKLKLSYNNIDWERINGQLNNAVANIRLDSLSHVYTKALSNLSLMEKQLAENNIEAIPDSDVSIRVIEEKKAEMQKVINQLKALKANKKIICL